MRPPAAERRRPTLWDGAVALLVALAAVALLLSFRPAGGNNLTARIVLDGEEIAVYDLAALEGPVSLPLENCPYPLVIELEPGRVRVAESACSSQDCVRTGWADRAGGRIICLPNRLVITLAGTDPLEFDAVSG